MKISRVAIIGLGLIGGSVGLSVREMLPDVATTGWDADADVRARAAERGLAGMVCDSVADAVREADLVILCVPVGAMGYAAEAIAPHIRPGTIVSDVGSSKRSVGEALAAALPEAVVTPAHPVAGTENSGPEAGFATLFRHRWCIVTPRDDTPPDALAALSGFWEGLGATVEIMDPRHHDLVLAVTSHIPHLIAYTIVGTASDLEEVTRGEVIKYSAGGFRDFTRIASSDPTMWHDIVLANRQAILNGLDTFADHLTEVRQLIADSDGPAIKQVFSRAKQARDEHFLGQYMVGRKQTKS